MNNKLRKKAYDILVLNPSISSKELALKLNIDERQARKLIKNLPAEIIADKLFIEKSKKSLSDKPVKQVKKQKGGVGEVYKGKIEGHKEGFAFFIPDDKNIEDAFIHPKKLKTAVHSDIVTARIGIYKGKREAEVIKILERGIEQIVGIVDKYKGQVRVIPISKNFQSYILIKDSKHLKTDDVVLCKIDKYPTDKSIAKGSILHHLGNLSDKDIDNKIVMYKYGLRRDFPSLVEEECRRIEKGNFKINKKNLTDFRDLYTVTIDGCHSRDFDDAIGVFKENHYYALYIHIADVSRFVERGSALNSEAASRGTSVYFPEFAIPMLPEVLSNGVCSLVPNEDRYTVTVKILFDKYGNKVETKFFRSIINSNHRLTYKFVNQMFEGAVSHEDSSLMPFLLTAKELADILMKKRVKDGVIEFDMPEAEFIFDDEGSVIDIKPSERGYAERLIECFMISANESVAEHFENNKLKGIFRIHDEPDVKKIEEWQDTARGFGLSIPPIEYPVTPETVSILSKIASNSNHSDLLNSLLIRSMMRAEYTTENIGHFGLASKAYTHFTSPIRRYPDLLVHRALLASLNLGPLSEPEEELKTLAASSSRLERMAQDAEHDIGVFKKLRYLSNNYEEAFEGYINRLTPNGFFVYIEKLLMTGYVDFEYIDYDYFYKDYNRIFGEITKETYKIGDRVKIKPIKLDAALLQADFTLIQQKSDRKKKQ